MTEDDLAVAGVIGEDGRQEVAVGAVAGVLGVTIGETESGDR